ncbi:ABC transporter permease [Lactobacillus sp. S2-2]|uniref:YhgE/Pip domain-containing protein n=1 Tax=Lactobacillus sp. S2-2 TaxID=2692917 RepID=UPI001F3BB4E6|nr:ABC transporter permease [Lactobacillus sp. S2-2]MCF6515285.1 ABC transporter permease [Lactobacillus sp. S2-2]
MKDILKNKFFIFATIAAIFITLIMTITQIPSVKSKPQNIDIGIVNQDQGQFGKQITKKIKANKNKADGAKKPMFKWHEYKTIKQSNQKLSSQGNYATIIIPKNFTNQITTLSKEGTKPTIQLKINKGRNNALSGNVETILNNVFNKISLGIGQNLLKQIDAQNIPIKASKAAELSNPFQTKATYVHNTKNLESANSVFFQPIWIASLLITLLLFYAGKSINPSNRKTMIKVKTSQLLMTTLLSFVTGFGTLFYVNTILGYQFNQNTTIGFFLTLATFAFIMLFSGFISWMELPGMAIFGLLLFFSMPLMAMAPQLLPEFYKNWILPWIPMRFLYDGARELIYYGSNFWNQNSIYLSITLLIGLTLFLLEGFRKKYSK